MTADLGGVYISSLVIDSVKNTVVVWVTGGTARTTATLTCRVVTTLGRIYNRSATMAFVSAV